MESGEEYGFGDDLEQELLEAIEEAPLEKYTIITKNNLLSIDPEQKPSSTSIGANVSAEGGSGREEVKLGVGRSFTLKGKYRLNSGRMPDSRSVGLLAQLTEPVLFRIMCFLSPEDLCTLGRTSRMMYDVTRDSVLWKRLYFSRWSLGSLEGDVGDSEDSSNWKALYMERDRQELEKSVHAAPALLRTLYTQMATAKRSEPLSVSHIDKLSLDSFNSVWGTWNAISQKPRACLNISSKAWCSSHRQEKSYLIEAAIADFRCQNGLMDSSVHREHCCGPGNCCGFTQIEPYAVWICNSTGYVHFCEMDCQARQVDPDSSSWVCPISGRCWDRMLVEDEEQHGQDQGGEEAKAEEEWQADEGITGRLGRWFYAGYNAASEQELLMCGIRLA